MNMEPITTQEMTLALLTLLMWGVFFFCMWFFVWRKTEKISHQELTLKVIQYFKKHPIQRVLTSIIIVAWVLAGIAYALFIIGTIMVMMMRVSQAIMRGDVSIMFGVLCILGGWIAAKLNN